MFKITQKQWIYSLVIIAIALYINRSYLEKYYMELFTNHKQEKPVINEKEKPARGGRRFFWGFNPPTRNMTYDIRHDRDARNPFKPKEAGVFLESHIYPNYQD